MFSRSKHEVARVMIRLSHLGASDVSDSLVQEGYWLCH